MRKLILIRHAKSSWKHPELDDHERPLNKRGERDSLTIARHLQAQSEIALDLAQTISDFCYTSLIPDLSFYTFDTDELLEILRSLPNEASQVAVVGHNPAITQAVNRLTASQLLNVPTSGVVTIECPIEEWHQLDEGLCELLSVTTPKTLLV